MVDEQQKHDCEPEAYRDYLRLWARLLMPRKLQRKLDASDLVQDALLKAFTNAHQFQGNTSGRYKAWLRVILKNILLDRVEKYGRSREVEQSSEVLEFGLEGVELSPSGRAIREEQLERLARLLAELPEDQQQVLVRKHCLGEKLDDIAEELGRTPASVAGLLRRGLERLRNNLQED